MRAAVSGILLAPTRWSNSQRLAVAVVFAVLTGIVSALFYNPFDVPAYGKFSLMILRGENIYPSAVYPPSLYLLGASVFAIMDVVTIPVKQPHGMLSVGVFGFICTITLAIVTVELFTQR